MATLKSIKNKYLTVSDGTDLGVTTNTENISLLSFKLATAGRNITVARNGNNIQGAAADLTIATNRAAIGLVYVNATEGWVLIEN